MNQTIVIISENKDQSTSKIIRWLHHLKANYIRINIDDPRLTVSRITHNEAHLSTQRERIIIPKSSLVWVRRFSSSSSFFMKGSSTKFEDQVKMFEFHEAKEIFKSFIHFLRNHCHILCDPEYLSVNKTHVLLEAHRLGITTPPWIITNHKKDVDTFMKHYGDLIHKTFNQFTFTQGNSFQKVLAHKLSEDTMETLPTTFNTAFFQQYIKKKYELRIFFFKETFFSMGIFSQNDDTTKVDFRNYNREHPNRNVPVSIPQAYQEQLLNLASSLNLDSGSFDVLVDENDRYWFLEVNPIGQFGMVSYPCNYHIERFIAHSLISHSQQSTLV